MQKAGDADSRLTPLPQAPAPQHNAIPPYSDQNYAVRQASVAQPLRHLHAADHSAPVNVTNSPRVDQTIKDGKIYLSLNDAIALALENNLDIGIQRYNLSIADTDILRTSSGAVALGVNAGLVQGTPGGTTGTTSAGGTGTSSTGSTGGGAGGTTIGVGGAGSGAAGIVASTQGEGPPLDSYDPVITGNVAFRARRHARIQHHHHRHEHAVPEHRPRPTFFTARAFRQAL